MDLYSDISAALQRGRIKIVSELTKKAVEEGLPVQEILNKGLLSGMGVIGEKFKNDEIFLPEVMIAARAMAAGTEILRPLLAGTGAKTAGRVCLGTVKGDMHDIGKNLVRIMMEGKGLEVVDLGVDVSPQRFIETAVGRDCSVIACSALLTTSMSVMGDVVKAAEEAGIRDKVKIMIGGAPVTQEFCDRIGADSYTPDAARAAEAALSFCQK